MKKYLIELIVLTILIFFLGYIICFSSYVSERVVFSFDLWLKKIVPTILPTFLITDFIMSNTFINLFSKYFHINPIFFISIISGSPTNAYILKNSRNDITGILATTKCTGLAFTFTSLKNIFNSRTAIILIIINVLCNLILYLFFKPDYNFNLGKKDTYINTFLISIRNCMITLLNILGLVIIFNILPISFVSNSFLKGLLYSVVEVTSLFDYLSYCNLPHSFKLLFSIIGMSTCGLCISMQIKSIIKDTIFNYKLYIKYRLYHLILFLVLGLLLI